MDSWKLIQLKKTMNSKKLKWYLDIQSPIWMEMSRNVLTCTSRIITTNRIKTSVSVSFILVVNNVYKRSHNWFFFSHFYGNDMGQVIGRKTREELASYMQDLIRKMVLYNYSFESTISTQFLGKLKDSQRIKLFIIWIILSIYILG